SASSTTARSSPRAPPTTSSPTPWSSKRISARREARAMLKVNHINVYYGKIHALKDVSFEVQDGEVVALIGANGAGKSTTLKTVWGRQRPRTGSIEFLGENITHTESHKLVYKGLAHVDQLVALGVGDVLAQELDGAGA